MNEFDVGTVACALVLLLALAVCMYSVWIFWVRARYWALLMVHTTFLLNWIAFHRIQNWFFPSLHWDSDEREIQYNANTYITVYIAIFAIEWNDEAQNCFAGDKMTPISLCQYRIFEFGTIEDSVQKCHLSCLFGVHECVCVWVCTSMTMKRWWFLLGFFSPPSSTVLSYAFVRG